jgi:hypothetical protein
MHFRTVKSFLQVSQLQSDVWNAARDRDKGVEEQNLELVDEGNLTV